jgi:hypothetical protein
MAASQCRRDCSGPGNGAAARRRDAHTIGRLEATRCGARSEQRSTGRSRRARGSVLADSALEHYRADFKHRAMYIAPSVAAATLIALPRRAGGASARPWQTVVLWIAVATGIAGSGYHLSNLLARPSALRRADGSFSWHGLFYAAPLGAPIAITLSGLLGLAAESLASREPKFGSGGASLIGLSADRVLSVGTSLALLGTSLEVVNLHFRGAFQNPFMYVPIAVPPAAAFALLCCARRRRVGLRRVARALLRATASVGLAGVGFHAYGIQRNMGGFRNWSQMILQGPPVPAPPAFTGLALAGLGALRLMEQQHV